MSETFAKPAKIGLTAFIGGLLSFLFLTVG